MKAYPFLLVLLGGAPALAQTTAPLAPADSGTFVLHKFEQPIGKETYRLTRTAQQLTYDVSFKFVDRGSPVPLRARLVVTPTYEPLRLAVKGRTSRMSTINDSIEIRRGQAYVRVDDKVTTRAAPEGSFPVAGYSPGTGQMLLLRYWQQHGRPASIATLPSGSVQISRDGQDTLTFQNKPLVLERYVIKGLVWGNELLWTDQQGRLMCIITNDAEGDKLEMMWQPYESLLPTLIGRAAGHGMRLFTAEAGGQAAGKGKAVLAISGGAVLDVVTGKRLPNQVVLIEKGKITKIGAVGQVKVPRGADVIQAAGQTLVPGLWDMHAHFQQAEWGPAYLAAGVTTVRDCGNEFSYINAIEQAINSGKGVGPRILKAGIIDGSGQRPLGIVRADTPAEAVQAVQKYKANGFVQIKLYSSLKPDIVQAICAEAHRQGLTVTGHIPDGMNIYQGVRAGMDQVNHLPYVGSVLKRNADRSYNFTDTTSLRAFRFLKEHHTVIDPTLGVYEMMGRSTQDDITALEPAFNKLPQPLQALFISMGADPKEVAGFKPQFLSLVKLVKVLYDNGITIVAGTDMVFPGTSIDRELELYVQAGLTPLQALQTATITPARVMKQDKQSGSIEVGKQADLVLVEGNPLEQIQNLRRVKLVVKDGRPYDPAAMRKLAGYQQ
ncbi:amidohydrolase family protein [Hymenobacter chitinivorans]|uniref:Imidazolonepropionase-like amidohydrolase n=1 Tax=Hymenobacter chitinivorans DSM 11115 TaxID=1121954 RepID=A0A2M9B5Q9_9BACT|nr:amidohydrolase family protein [Hymenobacter chitinivorans]PJJ53279.1 imidazolonepropionase-like amidohydrolase [Hymenobacter chitinivorans DSM 11115]